MYQLKITVTFLFSAMLLFANAQYTMVNNDVDASYKLAKDYFMNEQYSLAYPIFKNLYNNGVDKSNFSTTVNLENKYHYIVCGLRLNDASAARKAVDFIDLEQHEPRVQMMAFQLGEYFYRQQQFSDAIAYYKKTGIENLSNTEVAFLKFHKAYGLFTLKQFQEAKPLFNSVRQIPSDPNYIDANYYYGFISFYDKNYDEALAAFTNAAGNESYANVVPFYIAEIYYFNNNRDKALSYSEAAIKKGGQFYELQLKQLVGHLYFDKRQFAKAQPYLESYISKTEKVSREDLYELSYCYYEAGSWRKSIDGFKQLGGREDSLAQNSMYLLADAYLKTDQKINARNAFLFCASNNSNPTQKEISSFSYAKLSYELGYTDIALKELQLFVADYPKSKNNQEAKELLVAVLSNTSNYKDALTLFESLPSQSDNVKKIYPRILYGRAVELVNDQQIEKADILFSRIFNLPYNTSQLAFTNFWKGEIAYRTGSLDDAINYLTTYLKAPQTNGEVNVTNARYNLGYCLLKRGDYTAAQNYFQQIANSVSTTATTIEQDAYIRSGDCYFMNKQFKQAGKVYEDILSLNLKSADYALYQKAIIAGASNKSTEKIALMQQLMQRYPASNLLADANLEVANSYLADEKFDAALPPLQVVLKDKNAKALWPQAYLKTGVAYFNINKNDAALSNFTQLVKQYPNAPESDEAIEYIRNIFIENQKPSEFVNFMQSNGKNITTSEADSLTYRSAMLRYDAKDFASAKVGLADYLSKYSNGKYAIESNYFLAEMNIVNKDFNAALPYYNAVAARAPNKYAERATLQSARIYYFDLKDYNNAQKYFALLKNLSTQQENKLEAMRGLLRCQYRSQQYKDAVANAQDILLEKGAATDDKMMANMVLAKSFQADNQLDQAANAYKAVVALGKSEYSAESQYRLAEILFLQNKNSDAEKAAFDVIKKAGSYEFWVTKSYLLLGDIYLKANDLFNAEATFKSVSENTTVTELKDEALKKLALVIAEKDNTNKVANPQ